MEKICIVKRRKKSVQDFENENDYSLVDNITDHSREKTTEEEIHEKEKDVLSFQLTPQQCDSMGTNEHIDSLLNGEISNPYVDVRKNEVGQIVFKFNFEKADSVKMLKPVHVCQMLQISKGMLKRLVVEREIKSYKIGRLRRFMLEDILEYLAEHEEFEIMQYKRLF